MEDGELEKILEEVSESFILETKGKGVEIISHFDTDGITSAAIMVQALKRLDKKFSLKIVKGLNRKIIDSVDKEKIVLFLDLASGSLKEIKESNLKKVFIIDHHELNKEDIPENVKMVNPELSKKEKISSSGLTYLFCKKIDETNKESAKLAILGMVGDTLEKEIDKLNNRILDDGKILRKRGLLIYPSTRPLNKVLEFSSNPFIPGVTGNPEGVLEVLRESGISLENGKYKNLIDLSNEEMERLVTSIALRSPGKKDKDLIGDLFLINFFGKLEDAREISAKINACSREGRPEVALGFCLESFGFKKKADSIHAKYRQELVSGIRQANEQKKFIGKGYVIINAKDCIKDTMIGTISSIIANSKTYENGTVIIGMSYDGKKKIKVSGRNVGRTGRNLRELLSKVMESFNGEVGGHHSAAGCVIEREDEEEFIEKIKRQLELEIIRIAEKSSA
ncbi:MAG: DHH family phosphoesterase [archaeon]|nr:DHH family phosphoesterase [archaeon]